MLKRLCCPAEIALQAVSVVIARTSHHLAVSYLPPRTEIATQGIDSVKTETTIENSGTTIEKTGTTIENSVVVPVIFGAMRGKTGWVRAGRPCPPGAWPRPRWRPSRRGSCRGGRGPA